MVLSTMFQPTAAAAAVMQHLVCCIMCLHMVWPRHYQPCAAGALHLTSNAVALLALSTLHPHTHMHRYTYVLYTDADVYFRRPITLDSFGRSWDDRGGKGWHAVGS